MIKIAVDAAWTELERQAEAGKPGPYVDRKELSIVDGEVDMPALVRAVLIAIREPSEGILKAMRDTIPVDGYEWDYQDREAVGHWQAMVDALLAEEG